MITLKLAVRTITMKFSRYVLLCIVFFVSTIALIFNFIGAHAIKNSMEGACIRIFTGNVMVKNVEYDYRLGLASSGDPKLVEHVAIIPITATFIILIFPSIFGTSIIPIKNARKSSTKITDIIICNPHSQIFFSHLQ